MACVATLLLWYRCSILSCAWMKLLIPRIVYGEVSKLPDAYSWFAKVVLKIFSGETAVFMFFVLSGTVLSPFFHPLVMSAMDFGGMTALMARSRVHGIHSDK